MFEYLTVKTGQLFTTPIADPAKLAGMFGREGWELIDFDLPNTLFGTPTHSLWVFKRPDTHPKFEGAPRTTPLVMHYPSQEASVLIDRWDELQDQASAGNEGG